MPRNRVRTSYRKAEPRSLRSQPIPLGQPRGLSPLAQYLQDEESSGLPVKELIEQFQEYDCDHHWEVLASSLTYLIRRCPDCGKQEKNFNPGEKPA